MMRKTLLAGLFLLFLSLPGYGSETLYSGSPTGGDTIITFRFVPGEDMFYVPYGGNNTELDRLYALVDEYRAESLRGECLSMWMVTAPRAKHPKQVLG